MHAFIWCVGLCCFLMAGLASRLAWAASDLPAAPLAPPAIHPRGDPADAKPEIVLIGLGDSLTHGTMDGTNNYINTLQAYLQRIAEALAQVTSLSFSQPLFDLEEKRRQPFRVPTNLGGDGWAPGPEYQAVGLTELLFLFKDPDDADPTAQVVLPPDVWELISKILLREILGVPPIRSAAERWGGLPAP
jgi:hypothetical protein